MGKDPAPKGTSKNFFSKHARKLRASLAPGAIAIVLAGVHKGKRVIVLKQLGDIFNAKKEAYKPSEQRKADQITVDTQVLEAIKKNADGKVLKQYLRASFALSKGQFPHNMAF